MPWMVKWAGPFPPYVESASGAHFRCVDGHDYVDFCLGDTGAMAGHGPAPTIAAVERQLRRGITHMLPTEDAAWVGEELTRRFGLPLVAVRAVGDRRQPVRRSGWPATSPAAPRSSSTTTATTAPSTRRSPCSTSGARSCRSADRSGPRSTSRRRRASSSSTTSPALEAGARGSRCRGRTDRARADQRRDRAAGARLSRRRARADPPDRHAPDHRRDPHDLRRSRRRDAAVGPRPGHAGHRQDDRRRHPGRGIRLHARGRRADPGLASRWSTPTSAGSAARWPATRCRSRRHGRRSARS